MLKYKERKLMPSEKLVELVNELKYEEWSTFELSKVQRVDEKQMILSLRYLLSNTKESFDGGVGFKAYKK